MVRELHLFYKSTGLLPLEYLETSAQSYGDTFTAQGLNFRPFVLLSNPQAIQKLFTFQPLYVSVGGAFLSRVLWGRMNSDCFKMKNDEVVEK